MTTAVRPVMFIDSILEKFVPDHGDATAAQRREQLRGLLVKVVEVYADDHCAANIARTVSNFAFGFFSKSDWMVAKEALKPLARQAIANHFQVLEEPNQQKLKADALSEFLLRYLVTQDCRRMGKAYRLIPDDEWKRERMDEISIEEIIERAINGNGYHLADHRVRDLLQLINIEKHEITRKINEVKPHLNSKGELNPFIVDVSGIGDISNRFFSELCAMVHEFEESVEKLDHLDGKNSLTFDNSRQLLCNNLFELRLMKRVFDNCSEIWGRLTVFKRKKGNEQADALAVLLNLLKFSVFRLRVWPTILESLESEIENHYLLWPGTSLFMKQDAIQTQLQNKIHDELKSLSWVDDANALNCKEGCDRLRKTLASVFACIDECRRTAENISNKLRGFRGEPPKINYASLEESVFMGSLDESMYLELARAYAENS